MMRVLPLFQKAKFIITTIVSNILTFLVIMKTCEVTLHKMQESSKSLSLKLS